MRTIRTSGFFLVLAIDMAVGCSASKPPQDLVTARAAYERASHGPASRFDAAGLHAARGSLDAAEQSFKRDGDTRTTRDLASLASRRAQLAEAHASSQEEEETPGRHLQTAQVKTTAAELGRRNKETVLHAEDKTNQDLRLEAASERRYETDKRAVQAAAELAPFASVTQEAGGMVITLPGDALFASGKAALLPGAEARLNAVAATLIKQDEDSKIVVEGYADSRGERSYNQDLSQQRAQLVRDFLVSRDVPSERISAHGFGSTRPVADNATAEGRASNRRVEIVVWPGGP